MPGFTVKCIYEVVVKDTSVKIALAEKPNITENWLLKDESFCVLCFQAFDIQIS